MEESPSLRHRDDVSCWGAREQDDALDSDRKTGYAGVTSRNVKVRIVGLIALAGACALTAIQIGQRNAPVQASTRVARYADPKTKIETEPMLLIDPAATQRAIDAELRRDIKRAIDVEVNRTIGRALSDTNDNHLKDYNYW